MLVKQTFDVPSIKLRRLSSRTSLRKRCLGVTGVQSRFEFGDSLQRFFSQCAPLTSDFGLSNALDARHATVKRGDELVQMSELARSIRFNPVASRHHHPPELLRGRSRNSSMCPMT